MVQQSGGGYGAVWRAVPAFAGMAAAFGSTSTSSVPPYMTPPQMAAPASTPGGGYVTEQLLEAKLETAEARTETKFAQLLSEIKAVAARIGEVDAKVGRIDTHIMNSRGVIITTIIGAALGIVGLSYAAVQIFEAAVSLPR